MWVSIFLSLEVVFILANIADPNEMPPSVSFHISPDSLVDKASASGVGGRRFDSQCRRHWGSVGEPPAS